MLQVRPCHQRLFSMNVASERRELTRIMSPDELSVRNTKWLESHSGGGKARLVPRGCAPLSLGVPRAPVYRTPVQAGLKDYMPLEDSIVVMGSVIKGEQMRIDSQYTWHATCQDRSLPFAQASEPCWSHVCCAVLQARWSRFHRPTSSPALSSHPRTLPRAGGAAP